MAMRTWGTGVGVEVGTRVGVGLGMAEGTGVAELTGARIDSEPGIIGGCRSV